MPTVGDWVGLAIFAGLAYAVFAAVKSTGLAKRAIDEQKRALKVGGAAYTGERHRHFARRDCHSVAARRDGQGSLRCTPTHLRRAPPSKSWKRAGSLFLATAA